MAWNTPTMIIMMAANKMNPTAHPLVSSARRADRYPESSVMSRSLLGSAAGHSGGPQWTTDRTIAPGQGVSITSFG
jgi:hypothetical protein